MRISTRGALMEIVTVGATVIIFTIGQFALLWYKIGKLEGRGNGYVKCPFFRGKSNPHGKKGG